MLKKLLSWIKGEEKTLSAIGQAIVSWERITLTEEDVFRSLKDIHPYISPVYDYVSFLESASACMRNGILFYPPKQTTNAIKQRRFFLGTDGEFISTSYAVTRLSEAAIDLLQAYEEKQDLLEKTETDLTNMSRLLSVTNNLITLARELSEEQP